MAIHLKDGQNFVGLLMELCQGMQWGEPSFELTEADEGFQGVCKLSVDGKDYLGEAIAGKKKRAKQVAAKEMLVQLQEDFKN